jgi:hypothetical protein
MKNRSIFPCSAQSVRFKVVNNIKKIKQSNLTRIIRSLAIIVSSKYLKKAGYE